MDIGSKAGWPAGALSNFSPHPFIFDGVECASMEGLLQSFKFDKPHIQEEVCKLVGLQAKRRGQKRNKAWKKVQTLWWKGVPMKRTSEIYWSLLNWAYGALGTNESFRKALLATQDAVLKHSIGNNDVSQTVLTEREFCRLLTDLREKIRKESLQVQES